MANMCRGVLCLTQHPQHSILVRIMLEGGVAAPTPDDQDLISVDIDVAIHGMIPAIHAFRPAAWRTNDVDPLG